MRVPARALSAAIVVLGASLGGGAARAEPPREMFGGASIGFGTSSRPSGCPNYCSRTWGPALEGSLGWMVGESVAVRGDLWLHSNVDETLAAVVMAGPQLWLGGGASVRVALGGGGFTTHNADGGPGAGAGGALAITGSYELWRGGTSSSELELRAMVLATTDIGYVSFAFAGYAVRWD